MNLCLRTLLLVSSSSALLVAQSDFPFRLSSNFANNRDVAPTGYLFSPDGSEVLYLANADDANKLELYNVLATGGNVTKVNGTLPFGGAVSPEGLQFSPNGLQVLYLADQRLNGVDELYVSTPLGGNRLRLNPIPVANGNVSPLGFTFSPDSSQVLYRGDLEQNGVFNLYLSDTADGATRRLNLNPLPDRDVVETGFRFSPDGSQVIYLSSERAFGVQEAFSVSTTAGEPRAINSNLTPGGDVVTEGLQFANGGSRVIYVADQRTNDVFELFSSEDFAGGSNDRLSGNLVAGGDVIPESVKVSPDGLSVTYAADQTTNNFTQLFTVDTDGGGLPFLMSGTNHRVDPESVIWSPNSDFVLYLTDPINPAASPELYLSSIASTQPFPVMDSQLDSDALSPIVADSIRFSTDGREVYFLAERISTGRVELFTASLLQAGEATLNIVNSPLPFGGNVTAFEIQSSPLDDRVVYLADQRINDVFELFSASTNDGETFLLNATPASSGDVASFQVSPDGTRVLYQGDVETNNVDELFISRVETRWAGPDGLWLTDELWENDFRPDGVTSAIHDIVGVLEVNFPTGAGELTLGTGLSSGEPSVLDFTPGGSLTLTKSLTLRPQSLLMGSGSLTILGGPLIVPVDSAIQAEAGDSLFLGASLIASRGKIEVIGSLESPASLTMDGDFRNRGTSGEVTAASANLSFPKGFLNESNLTFSSGTNTAAGDFTNRGTGVVEIGHSAQVTFTGSVVDEGSFLVADDAEVIFSGPYLGSGIAGTSAITLSSTTRIPSPSEDLVFGGSVTLTDSAQLSLRLGSLAESQQISASSLALGGTLEVTFVDEFAPGLNLFFDLIDSQNITGDFAHVILPALPEGLYWDASQLARSGDLSISDQPNSYQDFTRFYELTGIGEGFEDDSDGDGLANGMEYLLGLNPSVKDAPGDILEIEFNNLVGGIALGATVNSRTGRDVLAIIETTTDLSDDDAWTSLATRTNGIWTEAPAVTVEPAGEGRARISLLDAPLADQKRFYRLKAELLP